MPEFGFDLQKLASDVALVLLAFVLALPIGWQRGKGHHSVGFRTLPIVAVASCGFAIIIDTSAAENIEARARVLQGVVTGIGFIGGGAILKHGTSIRGLVTAASIWNAGAIGVAVGFGRANIALVLSLVNFTSLVVLSLFGVHDNDGE
ncbi:MgtC/SapB family protein [Chelativorans sp. M5D2P16]|uniref:MgtC/SapB family protein n=1 Tax=Chelativorans sp. M5D2P16 TaxID=3095678 RepID=UPI002ACADFFA|nr:MgtC/SapB family protein [Chelativorans sp. M5D2P16]MDZ5695835.1 MgtC/SapB family protein [Chelativorans sp. M5D2P16]